MTRTGNNLPATSCSGTEVGSNLLSDQDNSQRLPTPIHLTQKKSSTGRKIFGSLGAALFVLFALPAMAIGIPFAMVACAIGGEGSLAPLRSIRRLLVFLVHGTSFQLQKQQLQEQQPKEKQLQKLHALALALKENFRYVHEDVNRKSILSFLDKIATCDDPRVVPEKEFEIKLENISGGQPETWKQSFMLFDLIFSLNPPPQERLALDFLESLDQGTLGQFFEINCEIFYGIAFNGSDRGCVRILNLLGTCPEDLQKKMLTIKNMREEIPLKFFHFVSSNRKKTRQKLRQMTKSWKYAPDEAELRKSIEKILKDWQKTVAAPSKSSTGGQAATV
ncbi:MAG: hypothetical protein LBT98_03535 [Puniceicoccales bacterium]|nr:hypothetical protein [Puniceicoccales bacterium]